MLRAKGFDSFDVSMSKFQSSDYGNVSLFSGEETAEKGN
jgi:hypothetical protein